MNFSAAIDYLVVGTVLSEEAGSSLFLKPGRFTGAFFHADSQLVELLRAIACRYARWHCPMAVRPRQEAVFFASDQ